MANIFRVGIQMDLDAKSFESGLSKVAKRVEDVGDKMSGIGKNMSMFVTAPVVAAFGFAVNAASDLSESMSKTSVVFSDAADDVMAWSEDSATAFGLSKQQALEAASTYGNLFTSMGMSGSAAADMSTDMVELAADLASFNNTSIDDALLALRSGLLGETEPLKRFGILINETTMKQKAMEMGLMDANGNISEQNKVLVRNALITEQSTNAQGDFARTSEGFANQLRILRARIGNVAAEIGVVLLPIVLKMLGGFQKVLDLFFALPDSVVKIGVVIAGLAAAAGPLLVVFGTLVSHGGALLAALPAIKVAMLGMIGPMALVIVAVAALAYAWKNNVGGMADRVRGFASYVGKLLKVIGPIFNVIRALLGFGDNTLNHTIIKLGTAMRLVGFSEKQIKGVRQFFRSIAQELEKVKPLGKLVSRAFSAIGEGVVRLASALVDPLRVVFGLLGRLVGWMAGMLAVAFEAVRNNWEEISDAFSTAGRVLLGIAGVIGMVIGKIVDIIRSGVGYAVKIWDSLGERFQTAIKVVGGVLAAIGPVIAIVGLLAGTIGGVLLPIITVATGAIGLVIGIVVKLAGVFGLLFSPLGLIIAALVLIGIAYKTNFLGFGDAVRRVAKFLGSLDWKGWGKSVVSAVTMVFGVIKKFLGQVIKTFEPLTTYVSQSFDNLRKIFKAQGLVAVIKRLPEVFWGSLQRIPQVFAKLGPLIANTMANAVGSIRTGIKPIDDALAQLTKVFRDVAAFLGALFSGDFGAAFDSLKSLWTNWVIYASMLGEMLWNGIKAGFNAIPWGTIWDFISGIDYLGLGADILAGIVTAVGAVGSLVEKLKPHAVEFLNGFIAWIVGFDWAGIGRTILVYIGNAVVAIGSLLLTLVPKATEFLNGFVDWIAGYDWVGLGSTLLGYIGEAVGAIGSLLLMLEPKATEFLSGFVDWLAGYDWIGLGSTILVYIGNAVAAIGSLLELLKPMAKEFLSGFVDWLTGYDWVGLGSTLLGYIGNAVAAIGSLLLTLEPKATEFLGGFVDWIAGYDWLGLGSTVLGYIGNAVGAIGSLLLTLQPMAMEFLGGFVDWIAGYDWVGLGLTILVYIGNAVGAIGSLLELLKPKAVQLLNGFRTKLTEAWQSVVTWFRQIPGWIAAAAGDLYPVLHQKAVALINGFRSKVAEAWESVVTWLRGRKEAVAGFFTNSFNWLWQGGRDLMEGLLSGLTGIWTDKVKPWIDEKVAYIKSIPGISWLTKSPSKIYRNYGRDLMAGLQIGMEDGDAGVMNALGSTIDGIANASFSGPTLQGATQGAGGQFAITINVNGAGNPQAVGDAVYAVLSRELALRNGV